VKAFIVDRYRKKSAARLAKWDPELQKNDVLVQV